MLNTVRRHLARNLTMQYTYKGAVAAGRLAVFNGFFIQRVSYQVFSGDIGVVLQTMFINR